MTEQVALCDQVVDVAVLSEVDKGRHVPVVGGRDVVVGVGVTEQVVDRPGLAVPVD